jgi:hypothetical protein
MNRLNDPLFDSRIADWLEDDANRAPGHMLDTILAAVPSISQRRHLPTPWRFNPMPNSLRLAAAAVVGVIALGVIYMNLPGRDDVGGPQPTTFTSALFGYTVDLQGSWTVTPATERWPAGSRLEPDQADADWFRLDGSAAAIAAQDIPEGTTAAGWLARWEQIREDIGGHCFGSATPWTATMVGDFEARRIVWECDNPENAQSNWTEYVFPVSDMGFVISGTPSLVETLAASFRTP